MKKLFAVLLIVSLFTILTSESCVNDERPANTSAKDEQVHTENNQQNLNKVQPPPTINWSLERDNLIKRSKLQNDRAVTFFMYVFIEGVAQPIGYYQVNKVSSVNSQLTNTEQLVRGDVGQYSGDFVMPSPAEDGSYGTNGNGVFGFTPEDIYIETNMKYITSTVPLHFATAVTKLAIIDTDEAKKLLEASKSAMNKK
jgi:hypothetical protein